MLTACGDCGTSPEFADEDANSGGKTITRRACAVRRRFRIVRFAEDPATTPGRRGSLIECDHALKGIPVGFDVFLSRFVLMTSGATSMRLCDPWAVKLTRHSACGPMAAV